MIVFPIKCLFTYLTIWVYMMSCEIRSMWIPFSKRFRNFQVSYDYDHLKYIKVFFSSPCSELGFCQQLTHFSANWWSVFHFWVIMNSLISGFTCRTLMSVCLLPFFNHPLVCVCRNSCLITYLVHWLFKGSSQWFMYIPLVVEVTWLQLWPLACYPCKG